MMATIPKRAVTTHIIVHCSATEQGSVSSFREYHVKHNGWADIGYHYVVGNGHGMPDGKIEAGRNEALVGAHCVGYNSVSLGVCVVGNTDKAPMTKAQADSLIAELVYLGKKYKIPASNILGHRETPSGKKEGKTCPGTLVNMDAIRKLVAAKL